MTSDSKPYPAAAVSAVVDEALKGFRYRRNKYEMAADALLRVADDFDGNDAVALETVLAVLRSKEGL